MHYFPINSVLLILLYANVSAHRVSVKHRISKKTIEELRAKLQKTYQITIITF